MVEFQPNLPSSVRRFGDLFFRVLNDKQFAAKMLTSKKTKQANQEKDAKVEARLAAVEAQLKTVREDTDKLQKLLADHPDDHVRMLLNSISSNLQGDLSKTIDDAQALHEMTTQAKESLNEFNKVKSAFCGEKVVSEEIKQAASDLRLMSGNDLDTFILVILNGFRSLGWSEIQLNPSQSLLCQAPWSFRDGDTIDSDRALNFSTKHFTFMTTSEGRNALLGALSDLGFTTKPAGYKGNIVVYK